MTVTEFPCTCRQGLSTCSTLGTGTLAEASPRLWSLSSVVLGEVCGEQALSALLWLTGLSLCFVTLRMELLTFNQTGCLQSLLFGDKAASCNFFSNCPYLITQGQEISPGSMTLSVASHSAYVMKVHFCWMKLSWHLNPMVLIQRTGCLVTSWARQLPPRDYGTGISLMI